MSEMKIYNRFMRAVRRSLCGIVITLSASLLAQQPANEPLSLGANKLPKASLWNQYSFDLEANGGVGPYHWRMAGGALPRALQLEESGRLLGTNEEQGEWKFKVVATDQAGKTQEKTLTLSVDTPLTTAWLRHAQVNGQRIDGSIRVSNTTGRDFDLTFIVLAVNDIGRATAIGYQRFSLRSNTRDQELPFGERLSPGNYVVNVDVVGEEPQSRMIFRSRLVSGKEAITQGP
jgi:hypothetical protein